jgi:hypothetical protein
VRIVKLTDEQFDTIERALKADFKNAEALGALPIGAEIEADIRSAYEAIQTSYFTEEDIEAIARTVVARSRGAMRQAIGDVTPKQYDRADIMAAGIKNAVISALNEIGLYDEVEATRQ